MIVRRRLTLCGSFGFGNAGDEALPAALCRMARSREIELDISLLSRFDDSARADVIGLGPAHAARREALRGDPLLMAGGGIVEPGGLAVVHRCARFLRSGFAPRAGLFAVNVESGVAYPLRERIALAARLIGLPLLSTRDPDSAARLRRLLPGRRIRVLGDSALWIGAGELPAEIPPSERYVAVALAPRWADEPAFFEWIVPHLAGLSRQLDARIVFVPMSAESDDDRPVHRAVAARLAALGEARPSLALERALAPEALAAVFGASRLTIGMRLHACVFAFSQRTPFVALGYHPKLRGFARSVGWERFVAPPRLPARQSPGSYGFRFAESGLAACDLVEIALAAAEHREFAALDELKERLAGTLAEFLG